MIIECGTDVGAVRKTNQDSCECGMFSPGNYWGIVCDGMGGVNGGNIASALALETIRDFIVKEFRTGLSQGNIKAMMQNAVNRANDAVYEKACEDESLHGMGTTAILLLIVNEAVHIVHVGDSRVYLKNEKGIERLTVDHSYVQNLVDFGQITEEEARIHPKRNIITRVVGVHENVQCDYISVDMEPGNALIACTDGLTTYAEDDLLYDYMQRFTGKELVKELIQYAVSSGGADNISVIAVHNE